jgi:hypothetical protein
LCKDFPGRLIEGPPAADIPCAEATPAGAENPVRGNCG